MKDEKKRKLTIRESKYSSFFFFIISVCLFFLPSKQPTLTISLPHLLLSRDDKNENTKIDFFYKNEPLMIGFNRSKNELRPCQEHTKSFKKKVLFHRAN